MEFVIIFIAFIVGCIFHSKFSKRDENDFDMEKVTLRAKITELQKQEVELQELKTKYKNLQRENDRLEDDYNERMSKIVHQYNEKHDNYVQQFQARTESLNNRENSLNSYKTGVDEYLRKKIQLFEYEKRKLERNHKIEMLEFRQGVFKESEALKKDLTKKYLITVLKNILINRYLQEAENLKSLAETEEYTLRLKVNEIPVLSAFVADVNEAQDERISNWFLLRKYKSEKAADFIKARKREMRDLRIENKNLQYKILAYESFFPILKDYDNESISAKPDIPDYDDEKGDRTHYWITDTEYRTLSVTERNQRALDNYWNRKNKTHTEIGADYEKSIGYWEYEKKGWNVEYFGIDKGVEDMGRDLICISPDKQRTHIVQCKFWSSKKEIHENHINQLFGTTVRFIIESTGSRSIGEIVKILDSGTVVPVFYTKTKLSPTAKSFAETLGIEVHENVEMKLYPMVKCNVSRRSQEKIYHLPFDQQYENIKIEPPEEFIAMTVAEAEQAGFRRAFKWRGT